MEKATTPSRGQAWFCTIGLPSDVVVDVEDMTFHLHKFPLMSKSKKLHDLIAAQEAKPAPKPPPPPTNLSSSRKGKSKQGETKTDLDNDDDNDNDSNYEIKPVYDNEEDDVIDEEHCHVSFPCFPGGSETFETAAKFCYGVKIEITAGKVAPLRCAAEVLEMTEEYSEDNLVSKTERFFSHTVLKNIKDSITALKSCERLSPLGENLGIVDRCIEAISSKAALYDPTLFGWPVNDVSSTTTTTASASDHRKKKYRDNSWIEDLAQLGSELFDRVISAMRDKQLNPEIIESCLIQYAKRCFPGVTRSNRKLSSSTIASEAEQRELLEKIVSELPSEKSSRSPATTRFLFGLLRTANILSASEECKSGLERKIGTQLEQATLDDLLIPSYSYLNETLYDVDCVERIVGYFLNSFEERENEGEWFNKSPRNTRSATIMLVGKLIDGYLSEIASDSNLKVEKFYQLASSLPEQARLYDDGIYRAIDVYLKAHPWINEAEREKICGLMDCQKLTLEACTHAAQNERLPLRAVVQVLFFEQLQLRHTIAGTLVTAAGDVVCLDSGRPSDNVPAGNEDEEGESGEEVTSRAERGNRWKEAIRENQVLRLDMDSMRTRVHELERECSTMKKVIEKIDKIGSPLNNGKNATSSTWRASVTRKFGCKFKTQVCDSYESTVVAESRRGRNRNQRR